MSIVRWVEVRLSKLRFEEKGSVEIKTMFIGRWKQNAPSVRDRNNKRDVIFTRVLLENS